MHILFNKISENLNDGWEKLDDKHHLLGCLAAIPVSVLSLANLYVGIPISIINNLAKAAFFGLESWFLKDKKASSESKGRMHVNMRKILSDLKLVGYTLNKTINLLNQVTDKFFNPARAKLNTHIMNDAFPLVERGFQKEEKKYIPVSEKKYTKA